MTQCSPVAEMPITTVGKGGRRVAANSVTASANRFAGLSENWSRTSNSRGGPRSPVVSPLERTNDRVDIWILKPAIGQRSVKRMEVIGVGIEDAGGRYDLRDRCGRRIGLVQRRLRVDDEIATPCPPPSCCSCSRSPSRGKLKCWRPCDAAASQVPLLARYVTMKSPELRAGAPVNVAI